MTPTEIYQKISSYLIPANCINLQDPMQNEQTGASVLIYMLPTNPPTIVFISSAAIDCDGQYSSLCSSDPTNLSDTSFHQSNGQPLNPVVLPWYVLPETPNPIFDYSSYGIQGGQSGLCIYGSRMQYGVFGDERGRDVGNGSGLAVGEVSYAMAVSLGIPPDPNTGGVDDGVMYIVFTSSENVVTPIERQDQAVTTGQNALDALMAQLGGNPPPPTKYKCSGSPNFICSEDSTGSYNSMASCQTSCVTNPPPPPPPPPKDNGLAAILLIVAVAYFLFGKGSDSEKLMILALPP